MLSIDLLDPVPDPIAEALNAGLDAVNGNAGIQRQRFGFACRQDGTLTGGLTASVSFGVLFIGMLWVSPAVRGQGFGRALMMAAEREGERRGARIACVDTLSTQAPLFYPRLGYRETGRVTGAENGEPVARIWFQKPLVAPSA